MKCSTYSYFGRLFVTLLTNKQTNKQANKPNPFFPTKPHSLSPLCLVLIYLHMALKMMKVTKKKPKSRQRTIIHPYVNLVGTVHSFEFILYRKCNRNKSRAGRQQIYPCNESRWDDTRRGEKYYFYFKSIHNNCSRRKYCETDSNCHRNNINGCETQSHCSRWCQYVGKSTWSENKQILLLE